MLGIWLHLVTAMTLLLAAVPAAQAWAGEHRVALVIGNSAYKAATLRNPVNDARAMSAALQSLGFDIVTAENATREHMLRALRDFHGRIRKDSVGLVYFAGHGMQLKGTNYLLPIDATMQSEVEVEEEAVSLQFIVNRLEDAGNALNIVILDACRDNPFERSFRSASRGLAQVAAPSGTFIGYATAPGRTAADGDGSNGVYTTALLEAFRHPGLSVEEVFKRVRISVQTKTGKRQVPWEASSLTGEFYFAGQGAGTAAAPDRELAFWNSIKEEAGEAPYHAYLEQFPRGTFAELARQRIAALNAGPSASARQRPGLPWDGRWSARFQGCSPTYEMPIDAFVIEVTDGKAFYEVAKPRYSPSWWFVSGTIRPDGSMVLAGSWTAPPAHGGQHGEIRIEGRAVGDRLDATTMIGRGQSCRLTAERQ